MRKEYKPGDRAASNIAGYYMGLPGRILGLSRIQYGNFPLYVIALDIGRRITLPADKIQPLEDTARGLR